MQTVNSYMLEDLLSPISGTADIDEKIYQYQNFDGNNEIEVKKIISKEIKPYFERTSDAYKISLKRSLSYFLTTNRIDYERVYDVCFIAFEPPTEPRMFFLWIWQILFPGENFLVVDVENYSEIEDVNEPHKYF